MSHLEGRVVDARGQIVRDAVVVLVPDAPLDTSALLNLRRLVPTDQNGHFELSISPGNYHAYALLAVGIQNLDQPATLAKDGQAIRLKEDERVDLELVLFAESAHSR